MLSGHCAVVSRGSRSSNALLLWALLACAGCSAILDPDRDALGGRPRSDFIKPDAGLDADTGDGDGDGDGDGGLPPDTCDFCDDGVACTVDACVGAGCTHEPSDAACDADERCQVVKGCIPLRCRDATDCNDGNPCNGTESCNPDNASADSRTGCVRGSAPSCQDNIECTDDACEAFVGCVHTPNNDVCADDVDCTVDICNPSSGCDRSPSDERCDACLAGATCNVVLGCLGGVARDCGDDDACTDDSCSVELAMCVHEYDDSDASCDMQPDTCAEAQEIELDGEGQGEVSGSLSGVAATYDTACGEKGARDAVYSVQVDEVSDIVLDTTGSAAKAVLAVARSNCSAQGFGFACSGSVGPRNGESRLVLHRYDPALHGEQLYILVDGLRAAEQGSFTLHVSVRPVASDDCAQGPLELEGCGTVVGFIDSREPADAWGVQRGACQSGGDREAPEAILVIPGSDDGKVALVTVSDVFAPALYARSTCNSEDNDDQLGCELGKMQSGLADFTIALSSNESAFVFVDGGEDGAKYLFRCVP